MMRPEPVSDMVRETTSGEVFAPSSLPGSSKAPSSNSWPSLSEEGEHDSAGRNLAVAGAQDAKKSEHTSSAPSNIKSRISLCLDEALQVLSMASFGAGLHFILLPTTVFQQIHDGLCSTSSSDTIFSGGQLVVPLVIGFLAAAVGACLSSMHCVLLELESGERLRRIRGAASASERGEAGDVIRTRSSSTSQCLSPRSDESKPRDREVLRVEGGLPPPEVEVDEEWCLQNADPPHCNYCRLPDLARMVFFLAFSEKAQLKHSEDLELDAACLPTPLPPAESASRPRAFEASPGGVKNMGHRQQASTTKTVFSPAASTSNIRGLRRRAGSYETFFGAGGGTTCPHAVEDLVLPSGSGSAHRSGAREEPFQPISATRKAGLFCSVFVFDCLFYATVFLVAALQLHSIGQCLLVLGDLASQHMTFATLAATTSKILETVTRGAAAAAVDTTFRSTILALTHVGMTDDGDTEVVSATAPASLPFAATPTPPREDNHSDDQDNSAASTEVETEIRNQRQKDDVGGGGGVPALLCDFSFAFLGGSAGASSGSLNASGVQDQPRTSNFNLRGNGNRGRRRVLRPRVEVGIEEDEEVEMLTSDHAKQKMLRAGENIMSQNVAEGRGPPKPRASVGAGKGVEEHLHHRCVDWWSPHHELGGARTGQLQRDDVERSTSTSGRGRSANHSASQKRSPSPDTRRRTRPTKVLADIEDCCPSPLLRTNRQPAWKEQSWQGRGAGDEQGVPEEAAAPAAAVDCAGAGADPTSSAGSGVQEQANAIWLQVPDQHQDGPSRPNATCTGEVTTPQTDRDLPPPPPLLDPQFVPRFLPTKLDVEAVLEMQHGEQLARGGPSSLTYCYGPVLLAGALLAVLLAGVRPIRRITRRASILASWSCVTLCLIAVLAAGVLHFDARIKMSSAHTQAHAPNRWQAGSWAARLLAVSDAFALFVLAFWCCPAFGKNTNTTLRSVPVEQGRTLSSRKPMDLNYSAAAGAAGATTSSSTGSTARLNLRLVKNAYVLRGVLSAVLMFALSAVVGRLPAEQEKLRSLFPSGGDEGSRTSASGVLMALRGFYGARAPGVEAAGDDITPPPASQLFAQVVAGLCAVFIALNLIASYLALMIPLCERFLARWNSVNIVLHDVGSNEDSAGENPNLPNRSGPDQRAYSSDVEQQILSPSSSWQESPPHVVDLAPRPQLTLRIRDEDGVSQACTSDDDSSQRPTDVSLYGSDLWDSSPIMLDTSSLLQHQEQDQQNASGPPLPAPRLSCRSRGAKAGSGAVEDAPYPGVVYGSWYLSVLQLRHQKMNSESSGAGRNHVALGVAKCSFVRATFAAVTLVLAITLSAEAATLVARQVVGLLIAAVFWWFPMFGFIAMGTPARKRCETSGAATRQENEDQPPALFEDRPNSLEQHPRHPTGSAANSSFDSSTTSKNPSSGSGFSSLPPLQPPGGTQQHDMHRRHCVSSFNKVDSAVNRSLSHDPSCRLVAEKAAASTKDSARQHPHHHQQLSDHLQRQTLGKYTMTVTRPLQVAPGAAGSRAAASSVDRPPPAQLGGPPMSSLDHDGHCAAFKMQSQHADEESTKPPLQSKLKGAAGGTGGSEVKAGSSRSCWRTQLSKAQLWVMLLLSAILLGVPLCLARPDGVELGAILLHGIRDFVAFIFLPSSRSPDHNYN